MRFQPSSDSAQSSSPSKPIATTQTMRPPGWSVAGLLAKSYCGLSASMGPLPGPGMRGPPSAGAESDPVRDLVVWVIVVVVNLVGREPETVRLHTAIVEFQRCNSEATKSLRGMGTEPTSMGFGTEASPVGSPSPR